VSKVQEKTPAEEAGVQKGDIIIGYAAQKAESSEAFRQLISETPPGTRLPLRIIRFGDDGSSKEMTLTVTLRERDTDDVAPTPEQHKSLLGMTVEDLTPQIRRDLNIRLDREGPVVTQVDAGGPADEAGVERRLILRKAKVGSAKTFMNVRRARDFDGLLADVKTGVAVVFLLEDPDDSSVRYFSVTARSPEK
jgi:serine protease Do